MEGEDEVGKINVTSLLKNLEAEGKKTTAQ
jgi:hypothetical protein